MQLSEFDYHLPPDQIARFPAQERSQSRLMVYDANDQSTLHQSFADILAQFRARDCLVINDTKVIKARLFGQKLSGGAIEMLIERITAPQVALAHIKANRSPKLGTLIEVAGGVFEVTSRQGRLFEIHWQGEGAISELLDTHGQLPLPPYLNRQAEQDDLTRYQTVYAEVEGSVAAPTAGLHFTEALLEQLRKKGVKIAKVTLQVGAGTFLPVSVDDITQHDIHSEYIEVTEQTCQLINDTQATGGRIIAVGTTTVRSLETACQSGTLKPFKGESKLFIYPGYRFHCIDAMVTNFHLPKSSLLILVSAYIGLAPMHRLYEQAITHHYRFYSYGDAMLLWGRC